MSDYNNIRDILKEYEKSRGFWTRLLGFFGIPGFTRAPVIKALRKLDLDPNSENKAKQFQVAQCFIENKYHFSRWRIWKAFEARRVFKLTDSIMTVLFGDLIQPSSMIKALAQLHQNNLLNEENFDIIKAHAKRMYVAYALIELAKVALLTSENFDIIKAYDNAYVMASALKVLRKAGLLTQANFDIIKAHTKPREVAGGLKELSRADLLTPENIDNIKAHAQPQEVAGGLKELSRADLLTQANFDIIKAHAQPNGLAWVLRELSRADLLTQANFDAIKTHAQPHELALGLKELPQADLLTQANFDAIKVHAQPQELALGLKELSQAGLLTQANFDIIKAHTQPQEVARGLKELSRADLLTPENIDIIKAHAKPNGLAYGLKELSRADLLTPENIDNLKARTQPDELAYGLKELSRADLLTPENIDIIKAHAKPNELAYGLKELSRADLLTPENIDIIKAHAKPSGLAYGLKELSRADLLTPENIDNIKAHAHPDFLFLIMRLLRRAGLSTQANFDTIKAHVQFQALTQFEGIILVLNKLHDVRLLTQANFERLLTLDNRVFSEDRTSYAIKSIPTHAVTQIVFEQLIERVQQPNPSEQVQAYVAQLLLDIGGEDDVRQVNRAQSTHTASVHKSVSDSAKKLLDRYGGQLLDNGLAAIMTKIKNEVSQLSDSPEYAAAKRCILSIAKHDFTDPTSKVTTRQLLALCYLARNDDENRAGSVEDANQEFFHGLYEMQRGYNLSESNVDTGGDDEAICMTGTFNKLIEKLVGIHPDAEIIFITNEFALKKLPYVVREVVVLHLEAALSDAEASNDFNNVKKLIDNLEEHGLAYILDEIKSKVADRMFDEFKSLYANNKENPGFKLLMGWAKEADLKNIVVDYQERVKKQGWGNYSPEFFNPETTAANSLASSQAAPSSSSFKP